MLHSIQLLAQLIETDTLLCPSHDYNNEFATTLAAECNRNLLLNSVLQHDIAVDVFVEKKAQIDKNIIDEAGSEIMCGATVCNKSQFELHEYTTTDLNAHIANNEGVLLIDIREPHEYALNHDSAFDQNVPLTRLTDFICKHSQDKSKELVLVCRSGSRSRVAAQALARLGFHNIGHLKGGYALIPSA